MKVLILAGGLGTRLAEETSLKPKPMVEIGGKPILWHIMKTYSHYGFNDFVILLGYKGYIIKEYFANYFLHQSDISVDIKTGKIEILNTTSEAWKITLVDTGLDSMTGGRIKRVESLIGDNSFMLTYGDGVANVDINKLVSSHKSHGKALTITSAKPEGRFGALKINDENQVIEFKEKPEGDGSWINAGYFVCEPKIFKYINNGDMTVFEKEPLQALAKNGEIFTYKHDNFWKPMDTLNDKNMLNQLWDENKAPWRVWE